MASAINNPAAIAQQYITAWNETDEDRRRALISEGWADNAQYIDPLMQGVGHAAINAMISAVQQRFPGFRFALHGTPDGHNDRLRFSWSLAPAGAEPVVIGTDFVQLAPDGRIQLVTGFLDQVPAGG